MTIQLYNTMTRSKEELVPRTAGEVSMYVCGPTVYNYIHIGNARTFLNFDLIRRYLQWRGYKVLFAQNITDVDDKIINRAADEGITASEVAEKYDRAFREQMAALGVDPPTFAPKATETIDEMIALVERLIDNGLGYVVDGDVYFGVRRFQGYGKLSGRSLDDMRAGERVEVDARKEDPMDFALWKAAKPGEPSWESPWGPGRPGWHLECSAMSLKYLGVGFDIHGGAQDLIFPHHENEIAQSEGAGGDGSFARYWMHGGLLNIDKEKMSKSLGNFLLLDEVLRRWEPAAVRMFMASTHYRNPLDFSEEGLADAAATLDNLRGVVERLDFAGGSGLPVSADMSVRLNVALEKTKSEFVDSMDDDFNSAAALGGLFKLVKEINLLIEACGESPSPDALTRAKDLLVELVGVLGIELAAGAGIDEDALTELAESVKVGKRGDDAAATIEALISARNAARDAKDWATADDIRDGLAQARVELEDTPLGTRWRTVGRP